MTSSQDTNPSQDTSPLRDLMDDLEAEYRDVRQMVDALPAASTYWDRKTPAAGWAVRDQISHLAFFDDAARLAVTEPEEFSRMSAAFTAIAETGDPMEEHLAKGRAMDGDALLDWWEAAHRSMAAALSPLDPKVRIPWFGPTMGTMSFVSARLMETWAHGQDIADAMGLVRRPTDRLRHVAHIGVAARPFSYVIRSQEVPPGRIDVVLAAPSGSEWTWQIGHADEGESVSSIHGSAEEFCLVVTQRRNVVDTSLIVVGDSAEEWMSIAQAFAGPAGPGRPPHA